MTKDYDLAERGLPGWHASAADGNSSTSGYGNDLGRVLKDLAEGAWIIDKAPCFDSETFVSDVYRCPLHGLDRKGYFLEALRQTPELSVVVDNYGLAGATADQLKAETDGREYGPMDSAPAEWLVGYWRARGAIISRYIGGEVVPA